jgi:hypothetical protein
MDLEGAIVSSPAGMGHAAVSPQRRGAYPEVGGDDARSVMRGSHGEDGAALGGAGWGAGPNAGMHVSGEAAGHAHHGGGRPRSGGTQSFDNPLLNAPVETDVSGGSPYSASEPLVSDYAEGSSTERGAEFRPSRAKSGARRTAESDTQWGEILALVFAAAVGIGCGFMFLKLFAPSLLAKWHF